MGWIQKRFKSNGFEVLITGFYNEKKTHFDVFRGYDVLTFDVQMNAKEINQEQVDNFVTKKLLGG